MCYYTHLDIKYAYRLGLSISLINDDKYNFLYYSDDKLISGYSLFHEYINLLYPLKNDCISAKTLLNILWGALCEKNKKEIYIKDNDQEINITDIDLNFNSQIYNVTDDKQIFKYKSVNNYSFKTYYGRLKPFILSAGRTWIGNKCLPYKNIIKCINTDGFITTEPIDINLDDNKIGGTKLEKSGICYIKNVMNIEWDDYKWW